MKPRAAWLCLILIALAGLLIRIDIGTRTYIDFDEWQHLFISASPRWSDLEFELRSNAHPPLFFLLLGWIVRLGHPALYRAISIAAGTGSIVMAGLIARGLFASPLIQFACAAAFALSVDAIAISDEIRSCQLAIFLCLVAFYAWLAMRSGSLRACIFFATASSLALLSHYSAIFFVLACAIAILPRLRVRTAIALTIPLALFAAEYLIHAGAQPQQGYLSGFYFGNAAGETLARFLLRNTANFFNLFSPVELKSVVLAAIAAAAFCALALWAHRKKPNAAILLAAVIVPEIGMAGAMGEYPFGGMLRHEYIAGPFLLLAAFAILDVLAATPRARYAVPALALAVSLTGFAAERRTLIRFPGTILQAAQYRGWRTAFPHASAVYLDHWDAISYFIHTSAQPRTFVRHIPDAANIDEYRTPDGIHIFYDKSRDSVDLADRAPYTSIASCLRNSDAGELTLFIMSPGNRALDLHDGKLENVITARAAEHGLRLTRFAPGPDYAAAGFTLRDR
ncbi:MAG TPA: hypothetical protein VHC90_22695 [Bryobacteraceae bacterium]|nr:hypothetical protein [Bryobacteraceae bacterium]